MTAVHPLLKDFDALRNTREIGGLFAGGASGLMVAASVCLLFAHWGLEGEAALLLAVPAGLAFLCTTVSSILAIRAASTARAIAWTFAGNVLPPTLLCLPTVLGVIYATPAGLFAFLLTLPVVLAARHVRAAPDGFDALGDPSRERLVGALTLSLTTVALLGVNQLIDQRDPVWDFEPMPVLAQLIPTVTAMGAFVLAAVTAVPELRRARLADRIGRGQIEGLESRVEAGITHVNAVATLGGGPMRSAESRHAVGSLVASPIRAALGAVLSASSGALLILATLAAVP